MTTLVYSAGTLCSDSSMTINGKWTGSARKIARAEDGTIGGGSGALATVSAFLAWIEDGAHGDPEIKDENFTGLLIRPDGSVWLAEFGGPLTIAEAQFHARGSGSEIAIGALAMGASADQAVEIACQFDGWSRGPIQTMRLGDNAP